MNDWVQLIVSTVVAPSLAALVAYIITRRKQGAEVVNVQSTTNGNNADTAGKYRAMLNAEIEERRKADTKCDELEDAFRQCVDENAQLRAENAILRNQVTAAGLPDLLRKPDTRPVPRRGTE